MTDVKVGDVFVESWGYDQTNVDFVEVVSITKSGKSVRVLPIGSREVGLGHSTRLVPDVGNYLRERIRTVDENGELTTVCRDRSPKVKLLQSYDGSVFLHMTSFSNAYLTTPEESHFDTKAAGYAGH